MSGQLSLFDRYDESDPTSSHVAFSRVWTGRLRPPAARATDPATSHEAAAKLAPRRGTQAGRILARLRAGPATNAELAAISLKYTGRISDLRAAGWRIECVRQRDDGVTWYRLGER